MQLSSSIVVGMICAFYKGCHNRFAFKIVVTWHLFLIKRSLIMKRKTLLIICMLFLGMMIGSPAFGLSIDLVYEFDGNFLGTTSFGTVDVTENVNGSDLDFTITANTANLGGGDIHKFYFNLLTPPVFTGLAVTSGNWPNTPYSLIGPSPSIAGGAGAAFDWGVSFGNGGGPPGNGILTTAIFTLSADQDLSITDLLEWSSPNNTPDVLFAVHFQGTDIFNAYPNSNPGSETVGGGMTTPIPTPVLLLGTGLIGLAGFRRKLKL